MIYNKAMKRVLFIFPAILAILSLVSTPVSAVDLTPEKIGLIHLNCNSAKIQLKRLQKVDSRVRVDLGGHYETLLTNFMTNLNLRLVKNSIYNNNLMNSQSEFTSARDRLKDDFIVYSQALDETISIDCKTNPEKFYNSLEKTRESRKKLNDDYYKNNEILEQHKVYVRELMEVL